MTMWMDSCTSSPFRHDQILPFIDPCRLPGIDNGGAVELVEDRRSRYGKPDVELLALVDRAIDPLAVEPRAPRFPQRVGERRAGLLEPRHLDRRHSSDAAHAIGHNLDRLLGRAVSEH